MIIGVDTHHNFILRKDMNLAEMTEEARWALLGQEHEKLLVCQNNIQLLRQSLAAKEEVEDAGTIQEED